MANTTNSAHPHILFATDRAPGTEEHLAFAASLANKLGARLTLYHAVPAVAAIMTAPLAESPVDAAEPFAQVQRAIGETAGTLATDRPVAIEVEQVPHVKDAILAAASRLAADLIVLPTHGRSGLSRLVLGSVAEEVVRSATLPVLLLTDNMLANVGPADEVEGPMVVATDLSLESIDAHQAAVALSRRLDLRVRLLSVVTDPLPLPVVGGVAVVPEAADPQPAIETRTKRLHELALAIDSKTPIEVEAHVAHDPVDTIVGRAQQLHAPFLVLTTHGRRGIVRMLEGSVAEQVVRRASTPVLVMPVAR
ncbi:MAG: nucleotide-binding universal stress UspA family protein [Planctomycetota bacterium]|jgi:nucleotide-binding universal stress UspA family protein